MARFVGFLHSERTLREFDGIRERGYLTNDAMWDFKVLKADITSKHTLQVLMYYIMGKHSGMDIYKNVSKLGLFNPRLNVAYILDAADIPQEVIEAVEREVIGY